DMRAPLVHWKKWPAALFRTVASLPAAKGVTFAAYTVSSDASLTGCYALERCRIIAVRPDSAAPSAKPHRAPYRCASTTTRGCSCPPSCSYASLPLKIRIKSHRSQARSTRCLAAPAAMTECRTPDAPTYQATCGLSHHRPELIAKAPASTIAHHSTGS